MKILSIETSCDETSIAILNVEENEHEVTFTALAHVIHSQIDIHKEFGGVFPQVAKREHQKNMIPVFMEALEQSGILLENKGLISSAHQILIDTHLEREETLKDFFIEFLKKYELPFFDKIAVTVGPGLEPALWVGINFAKTISALLDVPLIPVNHMEGHIFSVFSQNKKIFTLPKIEFPALSLLVSGGHTELVLMKNLNDYLIIGKTVDDAVGEAYDKVARMLGLTYPGGPEISKLAEKARATDVPKLFTLPRPMIHAKNLDFSFSGLKTAVLYTVKDVILTDEQKESLAMEFEESVKDVLISKTKKAIHENGVLTLIVGGGVSANIYIQKNLLILGAEEGVQIYLPSKDVTGDNALMIGVVGALKKEPYHLNGALPNLEFK